MREPLVRVVIPVYNLAGFLGEAIESALAQTVPPEDVEIIVVDDGSTDASAEVATRYAPRVRCMRQANRGLSAARNAGIRAARAAWLAFLDADDRLLPESLAARLDAARAHPDAGLVYSGVRYVDLGGAPLPQRGWAHVEGDVLPHLVLGNLIHVHQALVRREAVARAGGFDESLTSVEDWDLWLRLSRAGMRWACVDAPLADYRIRPGALHENAARMSDNLLRVVERVFADPTLPEDVARLRPLAFHNVYLAAACDHYRVGNSDVGARWFRAAVEAHPAFLTDVDALLRFCRRLLPVGYQRGAIAAAEWRPLVAVLRAASASVFTAPDLAERIGHRRWPARLALWRATASLLGKRAKRIGRRAAPVLTP